MKIQIALVALGATAAFVVAYAQSTPKSPAPVAPGSIAGKIMYSGPTPELKTYSLNSEIDCEKMHPKGVVSQEVVLNPDHSLQNVLIYVKEGLPAQQYPTPTAIVNVDQSGCVFLPHVIAVMVNQPVRFINSDTTTHNVHAMPATNRDWNVAQAKSSVEVTRFPKMEIGMPVRCNIHRWMHLTINVLSNPYFAVTGKDGSFVIKGLPPGEYTVEAFHEKFGKQTMKVKVGSRANFTFKG